MRTLASVWTTKGTHRVLVELDHNTKALKVPGFSFQGDELAELADAILEAEALLFTLANAHPPEPAPAADPEKTATQDPQTP
jgi:hypothetical protein